jgi:hypothetical protein
MPTPIAETRLPFLEPAFIDLIMALRRLVPDSCFGTEGLAACRIEGNTIGGNPGPAQIRLPASGTGLACRRS